MHEYSIVQALMQQIDAEARSHGATSVLGVHLRLGELSGVDPDLLKTAFETFRERSVCENAALEIERVPAIWACRACGRELGRGAPLMCGECRSPAKLASGDEIVLQSLDMEVPDV